HNPKVRVWKLTYLRVCLSILDHALADIDASHFHFRVGMSYIQHPTTWSTANIKNVESGREILAFGEESSHRSGDEAVLIDEACHLCAAFCVNDIAVVGLVLGIGLGHEKAPSIVLLQSMSRWY